MKEIKFEGDLKYVDPKRLIKEKENSEVDNFFLVLGLIFNDLKNLTIYQIQIENFFEDVDKKTLSVLVGEYSGMQNHLRRLMTSTIHESLIFIKENSRIMETGKFKVVYGKMSKDHKIMWDTLVNIAKGENLTDMGVDFKDILMHIRNQGTFHYWSSIKTLKNGYIGHFYGNTVPEEFREKAYFTKGNTMGKTRYFFSDASIQFFDSKIIENKMTQDQYLSQFNSLFEYIKFSIMRLMNEYISDSPV